jgi:NAD(P)-dependent dehydrogenase (short-subunit alcohol dehydrogenase family)
MTRSFLVTGASTGIGRACVADLVAGGHQVWAAVRSERDRDALLREHPDRVSVVQMDVTDAATVRAAGERVAEAGPLHGLVNNAGVALPGPLEFLPIDVFRRQIEVNIVGQLLVTQAMLPALRQAGEDARIVMVGSIGGRVAGPMLGAYHASKFGLAGLTDSLRAELAPDGIRVILVEPGAIATPIWTRGAAAADEVMAGFPPEARHYTGQIEAARENATKAAARGLPPERAARVIVRALTDRNPRPRQLVGRDALVAAAIARVLPYRVLYRMLAARRSGSSMPAQRVTR